MSIKVLVTTPFVKHGPVPKELQAEHGTHNPRILVFEDMDHYVKFHGAIGRRYEAHIRAYRCFQNAYINYQVLPDDGLPEEPAGRSAPKWKGFITPPKPKR